MSDSERSNQGSNGTETHGITPTARKALVASATAAGVLIILFIAWKASNIFMITFGAILFAIFLRSISDWIAERSSMSEKVSLFVTVGLFIGIAGASAYLFAPRVANQFDELSRTIPQSVEQLKGELREYEWGAWILNQFPEPTEIMSPSAAAQRAGTFFSTLFGGVTAVVVIIFAGFFIALSPDVYSGGALQLIPPKARWRAHDLFLALESTLSWWLLGRVLSMAVIGVMTWIGLMILDVPLALTLGLIAGLLSFIPYVGPVLSAIPAILLGLTISPEKALHVTILYIVIQLIEGNLITPLIDRRTVWIPPALTILAQLFAGVLFGPLGVVLATPLLAVVIVVVKMLYLQGFLGEEVQVSRAY
ncbi:MAG: AI-2E family transporter [Thermoanaerobaculia bacterium]|nr:AI-2E family transporter [Thermoanaerobaculia bacterium]